MENLTKASQIFSVAQYKRARHMIDTNYAAVREYCTVNKTNGIPVEIGKTFPYAKKVNNELRAKIETYEFLTIPPAKYFLYIREKDKTAVGFMGNVLGTVYFGREYRSNFGDKRQSVTIRAINGKRYFGTYFKDAGDYARIQMCKNQ